MPRLSATSLALSAALTAAATAGFAQTGTMTDAERQAFRAEVRAYLMENPEVIFEAVAEFERRTAAAQADMDGTLVEINADDIFRDPTSWQGANLGGDLTLVEFIDYRCSFCRRAAPQTLEFLGSDGNIRRVIKEFPILGPQSEVMSRFAVSVLQLAGDEAYEQAHVRLLEWDGDFTQTSARLLAVELGVDPDPILAHMGDEAVTSVLRANRELAQRLQISGTPTFILGSGDSGEMMRGFLPADEMAAVARRLRG